MALDHELIERRPLDEFRLCIREGDRSVHLVDHYNSLKHIFLVDRRSYKQRGLHPVSSLDIGKDKLGLEYIISQKEGLKHERTEKRSIHLKEADLRPLWLPGQSEHSYDSAIYDDFGRVDHHFPGERHLLVCQTALYCGPA